MNLGRSSRRRRPRPPRGSRAGWRGRTRSAALASNPPLLMLLAFQDFDLLGTLQGDNVELTPTGNQHTLGRLVMADGSHSDVPYLLPSCYANSPQKEDSRSTKKASRDQMFSSLCHFTNSNGEMQWQNRNPECFTLFLGHSLMIYTQFSDFLTPSPLSAFGTDL